MRRDTFDLELGTYERGALSHRDQPEMSSTSRLTSGAAGNSMAIIFHHSLDLSRKHRR